jgi:pimeloyl-ACP methyl ester carboxylesterase
MKVIVQQRFDSSGYEKFSDESIYMHRRTHNVQNDRLAVFIHGLGGSRYGTWGNFPKFLYDDLPRLDIGVYSYRTALRRIRLWKSIEIESEAQILANLLRELIPYRYIVLVGHSLGGVLAKGAIAYLVTSNQKKVLRRITGLVLMASPQLGSLSLPRWLSWFSKDMRVLRPHSNYIKQINKIFQDNLKLKASARVRPSNISTWAVIAGADLWVDELSSSIGLPGEQLFKVAGSHTSVVKPATKDSDAYGFVRRCISLAALLPGEQSTDITEGWERHQCEPTVGEELGEIRAMAVNFFGEEVSSLALMREWIAVNQRSLWTLKRIGTLSRIVGYFCILPLLPEAERGISQKTLTGATIPGSLLASPGVPMRAVYIGGIAGVDATARAVAMEQLMVQLSNMADGQVINVYTRPITRDGLRVIEQYNLSPLRPQESGLGAIYSGAFPSTILTVGSVCPPGVG